jgi:uncharacterized protein
VTIIDTGVLLAAADDSDRAHQTCADLVEAAAGSLITTPLIIAETGYLIERQLGPVAEAGFYRSLGNADLLVEGLTATDWYRIAELVERYADFPLGGADASVVAVAERLGVTRIATLDHRHFQAVRPSHCEAFEIVP